MADRFYRELPQRMAGRDARRDFEDRRRDMLRAWRNWVGDDAVSADLIVEEVAQTQAAMREAAFDARAQEQTA